MPILASGFWPTETDPKQNQETALMLFSVQSMTHDLQQTLSKETNVELPSQETFCDGIRVSRKHSRHSLVPSMEHREQRWLEQRGTTDNSAMECPN